MVPDKAVGPVDLRYVSGGCNLTPRALDWLQSENLIAYGSSSSIHLYRPESAGAGGAVVQSLCGHKSRVNAVRWINSVGENSDVVPELVSASSDSMVKVWTSINGVFTNTSVLRGHDGAVSDVSGIFMSPSNDNAVIASAASDFTLKLWKRCHRGDNFVLIDWLNLQKNLCLSLEITALDGLQPDTALLAFATENHGIQLYSVALREEGTLQKLTVLVGHEDWVRGLSFTPPHANSDMFLASSSQDTSVRVWRVSREAEAIETADQPGRDEFKMEKKTFTIDAVTFSVSLETVLLGHEGWVYAAKWFPSSAGSTLQLMTFSFDHTIILWSPEEESGVWFEKVRLGNVGGEALGFLGGAIGPGGSSVVAHTHQGSLNLWVLSSKDDGRWCPKPICGGHFGEVTDLSWERNGHYLLSVSSDQTTRLHAQWIKSQSKTSESTWYEMARPQIHGYSMNSIAALPDFKFVSAADEKVARAFAAPRNTLENLCSLSAVSVSEDLLEKSSEPMGATVPALGLSNKAVFTDESEVSNNKRVQNEDDSSYFGRQLLTEPPTDDFLSQNSLWPETMKLYGHGYDVYSIAASHNGKFVATACKATTAEHARIILWNTETWEKVTNFDGIGHSLTVTQMCFSSDDTHLLSVSRDRNWVVHSLTEDKSSYALVALSDKKTGVHSRIIWTCSWSSDSTLFATASREGTCAVWLASKLADTRSANKGSAVATKEWLAGPPTTFPESVTALTFSPGVLDGSRMAFMIAVGTENGLVHLMKFQIGQTENWTTLYTINDLHSGTISRLAFRPSCSNRSSDCLTLATSSHDHSVKIFSVRPSILHPTS